MAAEKFWQDDLGRRGGLGSPIPTPLHLVPLGAACFVVLLLAVRAVMYLQNAFDAVRYPFGLDYGEGIVWQQVLLIPGPRMYGAITDAPFIVFHYPPVYHLAVRVAMLLGIDPLMAGRGLSVACTLAAAGLCGWLVGCGIGEQVNGLARVVGCTIGALLPLSLGPVELWSVLMRVDMLAICLSLLGVVIVVESIRRPVWLAVVMPVFVLAVYTKHTALAAPTAALAVSWALNRRQTIIALIFGSALGLLGFGWLEWFTSGGFGRHIIAYNINTFSIEAFISNVKGLWFFTFLFVLAAGSLALLWRDQLLPFKTVASFRRSRAWVCVAIVTLWLIFQTALLVTAAKVGASINHFIELFYVCALPIGIFAAHCWHDIIVNRHSKAGKIDIILLFLMVVLTVAVTKYPVYRHPQLDDPKATEIQQYMIKEIARAPRPVLSDDMVLLIRAGREVQIEPAIFRELTATRRWDQTSFLQLLSNHAFEFVIILNESEYTAEMLRAIAQAYPNTEKLGPYTIHRQSASPSADERNVPTAPTNSSSQ
jgi:hypothetical protein